MASGTSSHHENEFSQKYTNANLAPGSAPYDNALFTNLLEKLRATGTEVAQIAPAIVVAILCGQRRADVVGLLYQDLTARLDNEATQHLFVSMKEAINVIFPFVGLPQCVPACFGLIEALRKRNIAPSEVSKRSPLTDAEWPTKGKETRETVYRSVGNPEVHVMLGQYFPEITQTGDAAIFGFLYTGSLQIHSLQQTQLMLAAAILSSGALRQAKSHIKASIGVGSKVEIVQAIVHATEEVARWNRTTLSGDINLSELAQEVSTNLEKAGVQSV